MTRQTKKTPTISRITAILFLLALCAASIGFGTLAAHIAALAS